MHTHALPDGRIISHSHPNGNSDSKSSKHSHSSEELKYISLYTHNSEKFEQSETGIVLFVGGLEENKVADNNFVNDVFTLKLPSRAPPQA